MLNFGDLMSNVGVNMLNVGAMMSNVDVMVLICVMPLNANVM